MLYRALVHYRIKHAGTTGTQLNELLIGRNVHLCLDCLRLYVETEIFQKRN